MWLGEQITERGLGNGISLLIFAGIAAGLPRAISQTLEQLNTGAYSIPLVLGIAALVIIVTAFVVFVERALRKILVNYAKRQVGNKVYQGQSSHLPLKLNMPGFLFVRCRRHRRRLALDVEFRSAKLERRWEGWRRAPQPASRETPPT